MRVIIAGSRTISDFRLVDAAVRASSYEITEVVSGTARGVDRLGELWAEERQIQVKRFPADWNGLGKAAGFIRNGQMAAYADALIAITTGSSGTRNMIDQMERLKKPLFVLQVTSGQF